MKNKTKRVKRAIFPKFRQFRQQKREYKIRWITERSFLESQISEQIKGGLAWSTKYADRSWRCRLGVLNIESGKCNGDTQRGRQRRSRVMSTGTCERSRRPLVIAPCENKCRSLQLHRVPIPSEWKGARGYPEASAQHAAPRLPTRATRAIATRYSWALRRSTRRERSSDWNMENAELAFTRVS